MNRIRWIDNLIRDGLSGRAANVLYRLATHGGHPRVFVRSLRDVAKLDRDIVYGIKNCGRLTIAEIAATLESRGINPGAWKTAPRGVRK